ncbi:MAG: ribulose-phosphate 3-epimerase [Thermomicrobiales bacterium]|nr:ribulose-phosphate 3-epimerase [Thermomicrobiales bacterium]MCO5221233.1 ribulose-phosphate 3-epimerase [Thermomicrobiales bacterium]
MKPARIGASILTADLLHLAKQIAIAEDAGIDFWHVDVMDGMFVPNMTFGSIMVETVRRASKLPIDVHLMIEEPTRYLDEFAQAGADAITIHTEATSHLNSAIQTLKRLDVRAGVSINPGTPVVMIEEVLPLVDQILVMSVNPGFGGQSFIPGSLRKLQRIKELIDAVNPSCNLEVDGGIKASNIGKVRQAGVDMFVVGSGVFNDQASVADSVRALREALAVIN